MSRKRGGEDEGNVNGEGTLEVPLAESLTISTVVSTAPATTDQALTTPEFYRHFLDYVPVCTLMSMKLISPRALRASVIVPSITAVV
ncbi:hypothetical protein TrLO_g14055 [Triparma laevis f. longispina]|uniref:Uncharacterized protein n=1 Tax=Triparma laevis f. longispina TaxID=1714387 RepID=A0A9W7FPF3_9STRA|nr:hypothetical protein TrLO_g14055 [Triparma laevis f. longispina]